MYSALFPNVALTKVLPGVAFVQVTLSGGIRVTPPPAVCMDVFEQFANEAVGGKGPSFSAQYAAISIMQALAIGSA